ncbi:hypothetical protein K438DRAFT_1852628 [Mycena galopus ATCC 62051]|nr:hypothetical protein K438DRAFT_1852628 [Mycena galopus ATCC 62051]
MSSSPFPAGPSTPKFKGASKPWVDPTVLPDDPATPALIAVRGIAGNAPASAKPLVCNVFYAYGVGDQADQFGYAVGRATRFVEMSVSEFLERTGRTVERSNSGRMEAVTVAEVAVTKLPACCMACVTYLIDNCASTPLVLLGVLSGTNGVGVTQGMNVLFHAPAPVSSLLRITSCSISMGSRIMSDRCEVRSIRLSFFYLSCFL